MRALLAIWAAAALSGGAALAYEICWSRALVVPLGNSSDATGIVLAGFMLGIGVGARFGGELAEKSRSPLRLYALVEILLGLAALVAPRIFASLAWVPPGPATSLRLSLALLLVAVPCLAMGASLPLLVRASIRPSRSLRTNIGLTYGSNTAGAAFGAFAAGFFGIAALGTWRCSAVAAAASFAAALLALWASRAPAPPQAVIPRTDARKIPTQAGRANRRFALLAAFLGGFAMLACEVLWARVLTFVFGHDTYAFASLLALVLTGLAIGGLLHRLLSRSSQRAVLASLLGLFAVSVLATFWGAAALVIRFGRDPFGIETSRAFAASVHLELVRELAYTPVLVLLPAVLAGAMFPTACSLYGADEDDAGRSVGIVGLVNGAGSALGALASAFGLVSLAGIQGAATLLAWLCAGGACVIASASASPSSPVRTASPATPARSEARRGPAWRKAAAMLAVIVPTLLVTLAMPRDLPRRMLLKAVGERHQTLLYYEEARTGTVSVTENRIQGEKVLMMNAVNEVTTRLVHDQSFKLLGHLAPLLHPHPKTGVMICLGAGLSAGAATLHPLERLDVVDLSEAVARAARSFAVENNGVLDNPAFRLHVDDGRQYLLNSPGGYDVAIIDSTHPKSVDSWILYTQEFYELVRDRLSDGGIAVQWLPLHGLSEWEFKIIVRTFQAAFPEMTLWANVGFETYGQVGYAKLVGVRGGPLVIDVERLSARLSEPRVKKDLAPFGIDRLDEFLDSFVADAGRTTEWTAGLPVQADDKPIVPYTTQYSLGRRMEPKLLLAVRTPVIPLLRNAGASSAGLEEDLRLSYEAQGLVMAGLLERAWQLRPDGAKTRLYREQAGTTLPYYARLAEWYDGDSDRLFEAATQLGSMGHPAEARVLFERALALRPRDFRIRLNLALLMVGDGDTRAGIAMLAQLRDERPGSAIVLHNLGAALLSSGDPSAAVPHLRESLAWEPESVAARVTLAEALLGAGELERAERELGEVMRRNTHVAEAHELLGIVASVRGDRAGAIRHYRRAIALHPYRAATHIRLGTELQKNGEPEPSEEAFRQALRIEPGNAAALGGLGSVLVSRGEFDDAAEQYLRALDADPGDARAAFGLGQALRGQGRAADAIQALCLAVRLHPRYAEARRQLAELGTKPEQCDTQ